MAKLYFRYGAMNSGKSTALLQAAYNYEERGQQVLLAKPAIDSKGEAAIVSRLGVSRPVDFTIAPDEDVLAAFMTRREKVIPRDRQRRRAAFCSTRCNSSAKARSTTSCGSRSTKMCRCSPTAFAPTFRRWRSREARRLLEIAHSLEELKTICRCGRKALFNARTVNGTFVFDGDQVAIDTSSGLSARATATGKQGEVSYESLCGACYLEESGGVLNRGWRPKYDFSYRSGPDADFS